MDPTDRPVSPETDRSRSIERPPPPDESQAFARPTHRPVEALESQNRAGAASVNDTASEAEVGEKNAASLPSVYLKRHYSSLFFVSLYTILAIFAWVVTCVLSFKPIGVRSYGYDNSTDYGYGDLGPVAFHKLFNKSKNYFRAAQIIEAIVDVLTLPLATAICASAAVVYVQQSRQSFSLRQSSVLADEGWSKPDIWWKLLFFRNWRRYGSTLLWLAILLHLLGFLLAPLRQVFVTEKTVQTPTWPSTITDLTDIPDLFDSEEAEAGGVYQGDLVQSLRYALGVTSSDDVQAYVWLGKSINCTYDSDGNITDDPLDISCITTAGTTFAGIDAQNDPFIAQLPAQFNTGLIRQFLPRLNSSLTYDAVNIAEFPQNCGSLPGAFYAEYNGRGASYENYSIQACMPGDLTESPWRATRNRQDIAELLYLNITINGFDWPAHSTTVFKVQANSTSGYFELPNLLNGGAPGILLEKDPNLLCDQHCLAQGQVIYDHGNSRKMKRADTINDTLTSTYSNSSVQLDFAVNSGPLLMVAMALFGESSYIATRTAHPEAYEMTSAQADANIYNAGGSSSEICYDLYPLVALSKDESGIQATAGLGCTGLAGPGDLGSQIATWLSIFWAGSTDLGGPNNSSYQMQESLTAALFLSNEIWLKQGVIGNGNLNVAYDPGADMSVPVVSIGGMIVVSVLLGLFLAGLFAMAVYASRIPTWTSALESFAMMRIGAAVADHLPLMVGFEADEVKVLDETPGWIGDVTPNATVGKLGLGARATLKSGRRYECYNEGGTEWSGQETRNRSGYTAVPAR